MTTERRTHIGPCQLATPERRCRTCGEWYKEGAYSKHCKGSHHITSRKRNNASGQTTG